MSNIIQAPCGLRLNSSQFNVDGGALNTQSIPVYVVEIDKENETARCINNMTYKNVYDAIMTTGLIVCETYQNKRQEIGYGVAPVLTGSSPFITDDDDEADIILIDRPSERLILHADDSLTSIKIQK